MKNGEKIKNCFLLPEPAAVIGQRIRERVLRWTGLPVCVGLGPTKTLAKLANHLAKQDPRWNGVCDLQALSEDEREALLATVPAGDVWGVGSRLSRRLQALGLETALDLSRAPQALIRQQTSVVLARTALELRGKVCLALEEIAPAKQQIRCSRSFGVLVTEQAELIEALAQFTSRAAEKLRAQQTLASALGVELTRRPQHPGLPPQTRCQVVALPEPSADTRMLVAAARRGLQRLLPPARTDQPYTKAGIILLGLTPASQVPSDLFAESLESARGQALMATIDQINQRFGRGTLTLGSVNPSPRWQRREAHRSARYTTRWDELPVAVADG